MIDFVKMDTIDPGLKKSLLKNQLLAFKGKYNERDFDITQDASVAAYHNLIFRVFSSDRIEISGSLHKYYNQRHENGKQNGDNFTISKLAWVITDLQQNFGINPKIFLIHNIEVGVNIHLPFSPNIILDKLICFKNRSFNDMQTRNGGKGKDIYLTQYGIKMYNKSLQYPKVFKLENILRVEAKVFVMEYFGLRTICLKDLTTEIFWRKAIDELKRAISNILICEEINISDLSDQEKLIWLECINCKSWKNFSPNKRLKRKKQFKELVKKYGASQYHLIISKEIIEKASLLFNE